MKIRQGAILDKLTGLLCLCLYGALLSSCANLSKTQKAYHTDITPQMAIRVAKLQNKAPKPGWQTVTPTTEIEEIIPGKAGTILVGFLEMDVRYTAWNALVPFYGPYVLYDTKSGRELWRHERDRDPGLSYSVLLTDPYLVYMSKGDNNTRIAAVNPDNGKLIWETSIKSTAVQVTANAPNKVLTVHTTSPTPKLSVLELRTGKQLWSTNLQSKQALLNYDHDRLLIVSRNLAMYSLRDGQQQWLKQSPAPNSKPITIVTNDGGYLVGWQNGTVCQLSRTGKLTWRASVPDTPELIALSNKLAIVAANSNAKKKTSLQALSLVNGKKVWQRRLSGRLSSALQPAGDRLVYATTNKLEAVSMRTGKRLYSVPLGKRAAQRLADHIRIFPKHIAVASESAVSGHDIKNGRELWRIKLSGTDYLTNSVTRSKAKGKVGFNPKDHISGAMKNFADSIISMHRSSNFYLRQARQNYTNVFNRTQRAFSSGDAWEKSFASFERSLAESNIRNTQMLNRSFETMNLAINGVFNALAAAQQLEENIAAGNTAATEDRAYKRLLLSYKVHESGLQGDYYMRPFRSLGGNGMVLVNMHQGTWTEIPTGPSETILEDKIYMTFILGTMANNKNLVTIGTGLDTAKWQSKQHIRTTMILRSLLSYNIADAVFHPAKTYNSKSLTKTKSRIIR